jgi:hypothetical protein
MNKNIVILIARGIEGCGVTKHTVELSNYLRDQDYNVSIIASKDKSWSRKNAHSLDNLKQYKFSSASGIDEVIKECQSAKYVIINSLPSKSMGRGKGHDDNCIEGYLRILKEVKTPFVLIQHDHSNLSIRRNAALEESIEASSIIFAHSDTGDFAETIQEYKSQNSILSLFDDVEPTPFFTFQPGMNFDIIRNKFWKDNSSNKRPAYNLYRMPR